MNIVAKRTGLSQHVIRAWERRYRAIEPGRSEGMQRLYSEQDVARLSLLRQLTQAGHQISAIANLPTEELEQLRERELGTSPVAGPAAPEDRIIADAIRSVADMDRIGVEQALRKSALSFGAHGSLERVVAPLTERIGELWRSGELNAAHEHFASVVIREFLWSSMRPFAAGTNAPNLVVTTPSGQLHELGAVIVGAAAADLGWHVTYLGPSLPPAEIASAAAQNKAKVVALSIVYPEDDPALPADLETLRNYLPPETRIIAGGRAAAAYAETLKKIGAYLPGTLPELYDELNAIRKTKNRGHKS